MPTCSQAKIINNLESDLQRRLYNLNTHEPEFQTNSSSHFPTPTTLTPLPRAQVEYNLLQRQRTEISRQQQQQQLINPIKSRRLLLNNKHVNPRPDEDFIISQLHVHFDKKLPALGNAIGKHSMQAAPPNFLCRNSFKNKTDLIVNLSSSSGNTQKSHLSDSDDTAGHTGRMNSDSSHSSECISSGNGSPNVFKQLKQSYETTPPIIHKESTTVTHEFARKPSFLSNQSVFSTLPKLALEIEAIEGMEIDDAINDEFTSQSEVLSKKRESVVQAKRLLALASIRPSRTFHKEITNEETEVLKRYYGVLKPRMNSQFDLKNDKMSIDPEKDNQTPILYDSAKISLESLSQLDTFLKEHKHALTEGKLTIEYNTPGVNGFVLRDKIHDHTIKFPQNSYDTFCALIISKNSRGNTNLDENHILRSINWNDRSHVLNHKVTKSTKRLSKSIDSSINVDSIKSVSDFVASICDSKLTKQVIHNGMDLSTLPGGVNFEMPPCDDFSADAKEKSQGKLKAQVYKKLKEKLDVTRVMWFSEPPQPKPLSVIFELSGFDLTHSEILEQTNKQLEAINGHVTELEFIPRSVHFGSVFVDNLWIITCNDKDSKYYLISHGILIDDVKILPKPYDEFMNTEYERYVRAEKYRELVKNHEKAVSNQAKNKKQSLYT